MSAEIHRLPGVQSTPEIMLGMLMSQRERIKSIVVVVEWTENDGHQVCWTAQSFGQLALARTAADVVISRKIVPPASERRDGDVA